MPVQRSYKPLWFTLLGLAVLVALGAWVYRAVQRRPSTIQQVVDQLRQDIAKTNTYSLDGKRLSADALRITEADLELTVTTTLSAENESKVQINTGENKARALWEGQNGQTITLHLKFPEPLPAPGQTVPAAAPPGNVKPAPHVPVHGSTSARR